MRRLPSLLGCVAILALAPAAGAQEPASASDTPDPRIADGSAQRALDAARAEWRRDGRRSYRFDYISICFCDVGPDKPPSKVVRDGRPRDPRDRVGTIPRLFSLVQEEIDDGVHRLELTYGRRGIPRRLFVDEDPEVVDEEHGFRVTGLGPLKSR